LTRVTRRDWERNRRIPPELAGEMRLASGIAVAAWDEAKAASDFKAFAPHLERQLELKHRYVECFPETENPYDVLLQDWEEGMTTAQVEVVFETLKRELLQLVERAQEREVDMSPLDGPFAIAGQKQASAQILDAFGFASESWRIDETTHPFASNPGTGDVRLTTHYEEHNLHALFSSMHEFVHGVYE